MASCSDLSKLSSKPDYRSNLKAIQVPILTSKKLIEPFNRLKNRANLFRRKNYSSQLDISDHRSSLPAEHINPSHLTTITTTTTTPTTSTDNNNIILKRSNSMTCPQQRLQTFLRNNNQRNSVCIELSGCSTDDYRFMKSSSNRCWTKPLPYSQMSNINEQDVFPSNESLNEKKIDELSSLSNHNREGKSVTLSSSQLTKNILREEEEEQKQQRLISPSSSTLISEDNDEIIPRHHQLHSHRIFHQQRESICSSNDERFYDCKQQTSPMKSTDIFNMSLPKISTCTMTGRSLINLDECLSTTSSEDKGVQTTFNDSLTTNSYIKQAISATSLSSSSTSIQTDSLENKPRLSILFKTNESSKHSVNQRQVQSKWPHLHNRLLGEQTCIYWVNYLGSTAIKILNDGTPPMPTHAINRLKQSTQYARVLPIIGLSISSRGVEFLKHAKDRVVICFHEIKSIHCACQDQDLRYFAYVTREQRLMNNLTTTFDPKQQSSPSLSTKGDYHNYCHVFVVKNESMSTEILLTFGQAFDIAYRIHRRLNSKQIHVDKSHSKLDTNRLLTKSNKIMSFSTHSPATSSSSSSIDERRIFV